jgi:putative peptide zinc metalloprotease protein
MGRPASSLIPSTARHVPLIARRDLVVEQIAYQGLGYWIIKDPVALAYYRLQNEQYHVLKLLDGKRSLEDIRDAFQKEFPTLRPGLSDLRALALDLHHKGLVYSERAGQAQTLIEKAREKRRKSLWSAVRNILYIKLPGWDPERLLAFLYPWVRWSFRPSVLGLCGVFVVAMWILLGINFAEFERRVPTFQQFFSWPNLFLLWLTMGLAKFIHELAHGLACKHYGGECHEIGMAFLVFSPCLYCDVSDSWVLSSKWKRILIASAGMMIEVFLSAVAVLVWWHTEPGLLHHLCLNVFFVTTITTVIFNANPLLRYDGYYILSDVLEIPNLRTKADRMFRDVFSRVCLGITNPPDPFMPDRGRVWFALFALASACYRWFLTFTIIFVLYEFLKPYGLQNLGLGLGISSALMIIGSLLVTLYRILAAPRVRPMSYVRASLTLTALAGAVFAGLTVPLPLFVEAPFTVEPQGVKHVLVTTPGRLTKLLVQPGQRVQQGQVLARLENFPIRDEYEKLRVAIAVQKLEVETQKRLDNQAGEEFARTMLASLEKRLAQTAEKLQKLTIVAPCEGVVVAPPQVSSGSKRGTEESLPRWNGTPLEERNQGCWLATQSHLLSVAPDAEYQAVLVIDQHNRDDFRVEETLSLKLESKPRGVRTGRISQISDRHLETAPAPLSNKFGGELATTTDAQGKERLDGAAYQAIVPLAAIPGTLKPGVRGVARHPMETRTAGDWVWRYLKRTFHFRM